MMKTKFFLWMMMSISGGTMVDGMSGSAYGMYYEGISILGSIEKGRGLDTNPEVYTEVSLDRVPEWVFEALNRLNPWATLTKAWMGNDGSYKVGYVLDGPKIRYAIFSRW